MESMSIELSGDKYDAVIQSRTGKPTLAQASAVEVFVKPEATVGGKAGCAITFAVQLPDGTMAQAQAVVTAALLETAGKAITGWRTGGYIR